MVVKFTEMSDKPFLADVKGVTPSGGMGFEVDEKTGLAIPRGLNREVTNQVGEGRDKTQSALKNTPLEQLRQSNHPRASSLITWIESNEENKKWYLENVGTKFDLVQDGIFLLGNTWELEDVKMDENPEKGIWNNKGLTYFSFDIQNKLFGDSVPKKNDWVNLTKFLPGDDANRVKFLTKVLGLNFAGCRNCSNGYFGNQGLYAYYWSSTSAKPITAYNMLFSDTAISADSYSVRKFGFCVRRFKN